MESDLLLTWDVRFPHHIVEATLITMTIAVVALFELYPSNIFYDNRVLSKKIF